MSDYYHGDSVMRVIEEFRLDFLAGQVCKYILRAGNKPDNSELRDLQKAKWYLDRKIKNLEAQIAPGDVDEAPKEEMWHVERLRLATEAVRTLLIEANSARAAIRHAIQVIESFKPILHLTKDQNECLAACKEVLKSDRANRFPGVL